MAMKKNPSTAVVSAAVEPATKPLSTMMLHVLNEAQRQARRKNQGDGCDSNLLLVGI